MYGSKNSEECEIKSTKIHLCHICNEQFTSKMLLNCHLKETHNEAKTSKLKCDLCLATFCVAGNLKRHLSNIHGGKQNLLCEHCDKIFPNKNYLLRHYYGQHRELQQKPKCEICMKTFVNDIKMKEHVKNVHILEREGNSNARNIQFAEVNIFTKTKIRGEKDELMKTEVQIQCEICDKTFSRSTTFLEHLENVHVSAPKLQCDTCMKTFSRKADLTKHTTRVHVNTHNLKCSNCDKVYKILGNLNRHMRESHERVRNHKCEICEATFNRPVQLREHMKLNHSKASMIEKKKYVRKIIPCKVCGKLYRDGGPMYYHVNVEHNAIKYQCNICAKEFDYKNSLKDHIEKVHGNIKKFECKFCHKTFARNAIMKKHIIGVHEGKKKYQCTQCKEGFHYSKKLRAHIVESHAKAIGKNETNTIMNPKQHNISEISISKRITTPMKTENFYTTQLNFEPFPSFTDMEEREIKDQSNVIDTSNPKYENTEDPLKTEIIETIEIKAEPFDCDPLAFSNDSKVQIKTE